MRGGLGGRQCLPGHLTRPVLLLSVLEPPGGLVKMQLPEIVPELCWEWGWGEGAKPSAVIEAGQWVRFEVDKTRPGLLSSNKMGTTRRSKADD